MRRSIATVSLSGSLQEKLQAIAAAKYDAVELCENDLLFYDGSPRSVRDMAVDLGLKIAAFQPFRDFEGAPDDLFPNGLERAQRKFDVMAELGAPLMLVCSNVSASAVDDDERAAAQLRELAELASRRGLKIGYQALAWGRHVRTAPHATRIVGRANHAHLGVALNSFHTLAAGQDLSALAAIPAEKMFWVQLADAPNLGMDLRSWSRHFSCFPGQGDLDVPGFVRQVFDAGYSGHLSLEVLNDELQASPARHVAADGMRSLIWVEEQVRSQMDAEGQKPPSGSTRLSQLPEASPTPEILGVAFLEFAVGDGADAALAAQLTALGFRKVGRHHSKAVTLYRQGDLAIALNAEQESFAYSFHLMHGPSVCALGLRVADVPAFLARAELYGYERFEGRTDAGDKPMSAIRRPDGSLFYILPADFDATAEFVAEEEGADLKALTHFDHIGEAVAPRQMDSWLLFYRAVLGLEPAQSWDLPDPYGLVRSRAMANASRTVRLPLSFSESARTSVARALTTFIGAGVNQIAFSTEDIYATMDMLRGRGATFVEISENYYDDLASRVALSDETIDRLKAANLLYDQDEKGGVFLHAYTEVFQGRFFFEVVQRTGGYDNYGAPNAAVRMAAQTRSNPVSRPF